MRNLAILGSTGSIGASTLAVVDAHPTRLRVVGLAAGENAAVMAEQLRRYRPEVVAMATEQAASEVRRACADMTATRITGGPEGLATVATHASADTVMCATSGTAGLEAVVAAIEAGKRVAIANKEVLVMAGAIVTGAARRRGVDILPVDSEHNALHQCLHGRTTAEVRRLILTASGGPFRDHAPAALDVVGPDDALRHPTWRMGRKITVDSATLMNKGLEVIEAHWLFGVPADRIDVVIHPQSIVHSLVELNDGSVIAQLSVTDMRLPIQYACSYPDRWDGRLPSLDLTRAGRLDFQAPDLDRFPCLRLAYQALGAGGTLPAVLNAANEVAVEAFLDGVLAFTAIPKVIEELMRAHVPEEATSIQVIRRADTWAREHAHEAVRGSSARRSRARDAGHQRSGGRRV
jgi:1-deoxy-D-xylulose-5-phosphate reductoisomerase